MARRRHTPEQIVRKLREADRLLGEGAEIADVARHLEVSEQTYHRWRNQYGDMKADDVKRLKELERENTALKQIVADKELEAQVLVADWREEYNTYRPHSAMGMLTPAEFARQWRTDNQPQLS
mgnify:CR=1 FL=1